MTGNVRVYLLDGGTLVIDGYHLYWNAGPGGHAAPRRLRAPGRWAAGGREGVRRAEPDAASRA
jgi:hypothetical protein